VIPVIFGSLPQRVRKVVDSHKNVVMTFFNRNGYGIAGFYYRYLHYLLFFSTLYPAIASKVQ
jgi:hypothetical protein